MGKKKQSRRAFIESVGATCQNWQWSWSFVNHSERFVAFGAWDVNTMGFSWGSILAVVGLMQPELMIERSFIPVV